MCTLGSAGNLTDIFVAFRLAHVCGVLAQRQPSGCVLQTQLRQTLGDHFLGRHVNPRALFLVAESEGNFSRDRAWDQEPRRCDKERMGDRRIVKHGGDEQGKGARGAGGAGGSESIVDSSKWRGVSVCYIDLDGAFIRTSEKQHTQAFNTNW